MMILQLLLFFCFTFGNGNGGGCGGASAFIVPQPTSTTSRATARTSSSSTATALHQQQLSKGGGEQPPEVYPLSRKKILLIEEAKRLNASLASSTSSSPSNSDVAASSSSSYSPAGWSNRLGSVLTPASIPGVYTADRPFYWNKIDVGCRMTVVQLTQSSTSTSSKEELPQLLIHSPVHLDPPLIEALSKLGSVSHIVSPNYEHVKYAQEWANYYPDAKVWGCPGLSEKMPSVRWTGEFMEGTRPPGFYHGGSSSSVGGGNGADDANASLVGYIDGMWNWNDVQPMHINTEVNPFTGRPFFNEVVFYHALSKTLIVTDLYWNYPRGDGVTNGDLAEKWESVAAPASAGEDDEDFGVWELAPNVGDIPLGSKVWGKIGMDKLFYPFYMNVMVMPEKRKTFEEIARYITCGNGWEVETIIPAHGDIVRGKKVCRRVLETFFRIQCRSS